MKAFIFCPSCATKLGDRDEEGGAHCPECGRTWYRNSAPTTGAAIVKDGRVLLTVRAREPEKGRLDVPGGFLHVGEDPVAGLKREVKEELGIDIEVGVGDCLSMVPHEYGEGGDFVLSLGFRARLVRGQPSASDDVADIKWANISELDELDFAWEHDRRLVKLALEQGEDHER